MVALKYAIMIDGVTQLIMMKSDVMNDFDTIRVATAYEIGGERTDRFPYAVDAPIVPVYKEFKGGNAIFANSAATRISRPNSRLMWSSSSGKRACPCGLFR